MRDLLSPREKRFLRRLAAGKTDAQIAVKLGGPWSKSQSRDPGCLRDCRSIRLTRSLMQPSDWRTGPAIEASRRISPETKRTSLVGAVGAHQTIHWARIKDHPRRCHWSRVNEWLSWIWEVAMGVT